MEYKTKIDNYRIYLFTFGILSVLYALEYHEENENFEECQKIIDAIKEQEKRLDITLHTRITKECIDEVIETYNKFNLTGQNVIENSKFCCSYILDEMKLKHT